MSIRVFDIDHRILVSVDDKDVNYYDKTDVNWYSEDGVIVLAIANEEIFRRKTSDFSIPKEDSVVDLLTALCLLSVPDPVIPEVDCCEQTANNTDILNSLTFNGDRLKVDSNAGSGSSAESQIIDDILNTKTHVSHFGSLKTGSTKPIVNGNFAGGILDRTTWTDFNTASGSISFEKGTGKLNTGASTSSSYTLISRKTGRFVAGQVTVFQSGVNPIDTGVSGNTREWGLSSKDGQQKLIFRLDGTSFQVVTIRDGVENVIPAASFNGEASYTISPQNRTWRIFYSAGRAIFCDSVGGNLRRLHTEVDVDFPLVNGLNLHGYYHNENTSNNSNVELRIRGFSISIWSELEMTDIMFQRTGEVDGILPSGAAYVVTAAPDLSPPSNVIDSGYIPRKESNVAINRIKADTSLKLYIINAESPDGYNAEGIFAPTLINSAGSPAVGSTPMFGEYVRYVVVNDSGSTATTWDVIGRRQEEPASPLLLSIDQAVFDFFPAPLIRAVDTGRKPDGIYVNNKATGTAWVDKTTTLAAGADLVSPIINQDGWDSVGVVIDADTPSAVDGVVIEFFDDDYLTTPVARLPKIETFSAEDIINGGKIIRFSPKLTALRVTYTNGGVAQITPMFISIKLFKDKLEDTQSLQNSILRRDELALHTKGSIQAPNDTDVYEQIGRDGAPAKSSLNVHRTNEFLNSDFSHGQINVTSASETQLPLSPLSITRILRLSNPHATDKLYWGKTGVTELTGDVVFPNSTTPPIEITSDEDIFLIAEDTGSSEITRNIDADTVDANTGVVNPTNLFASDDSRAIFDAVADTCEISGFDTSGFTLTNISQVKIKCECRKQPGQPNETAEFQFASGADADNPLIITDPLVSADNTQLYLVAIHRRDVNAAVTSVTTTMGAMVFVEVADFSNGNESRTSLYYAAPIGVTLVDGAISATFSTAADHAVITVTRISNVDLTDPIEDFDTTGSASSLTYSGNVEATQGGMVCVFVGSEIANQIAVGVGYIERLDIGSSTNNDQRGAVNTLDVTSTGTTAYSGTFNTAGDNSVIAVSLRPSEALPPNLRLEYEVSAVPGATEFNGSVGSETDIVLEQDITSDRAWTKADLDNTSLIITADDIGNADLEVDRLWLEVIESGGQIRAIYNWLGE